DLDQCPPEIGGLHLLLGHLEKQEKHHRREEEVADQLDAEPVDQRTENWRAPGGDDQQNRRHRPEKGSAGGEPPSELGEEEEEEEDRQNDDDRLHRRKGRSTTGESPVVQRKAASVRLNLKEHPRGSAWMGELDDGESAGLCPPHGDAIEIRALGQHLPVQDYG